MNTTATTNESYTSRIYGEEKFSRCADVVRGGIFREMLKLATPTVKHYQSDLYHDAIWLRDEIHGPQVFFWSFDDTGTAISEDLDSYITRRRFVYQFELVPKTWNGSYMEDGFATWYVMVTKLKG